MPLADISSGLEGYREEETYEEGEVKLELFTEVANISHEDKILTASTPTITS